MGKKVFVAMSGGVDSSVSAYILKKCGFEVVGVTMCFNLYIKDRRKPVCCDYEAIEKARNVALYLGIKHYVLNFGEVLKEKIIKNFCNEYFKGRTPNPCVDCNHYIKFGALLEKVLSFGADFFATGHYARIEKDGLGRYYLKRAKDIYKDQSYFLYHLTQDKLKRVIFPIGDYLKDQVRQIARELKLSIAERPASQDICFLPTDDYREFLSLYFKDKIKEGEIVDKDGNVLGRHRGICFYTFGQREGLGLSGGPFYIIKLDKEKNQIVVGRKEDVYTQRFFVKDPHFINEPIKNKIVLGVKIRYNHKQVPAEIFPKSGYLEIRFFEPQSAVTPGQSAVFYKDDIVVGGGVIETE
ncbi:MAG: tRNA 2-thiouridine(34) synthase MnmA [Candidatus Omnitrophica bacterium]|nr:tRNA 2-thiouridine(34) synthase MnmA [Candidatus Omnitrophota bacterium]